MGVGAENPGRFEPAQIAWNLSLARQGGAGYGRPSLASDAALYFQVGLVCAWLGVIPEADIPERIRSWLAGPFVAPLAEAFATLPPKLREQVRGGQGGGAPKVTPIEAREGALWALDRLVDGDSALLIAWETGPDGGRAFRARLLPNSSSPSSEDAQVRPRVDWARFCVLFVFKFGW
jgi:hypothetical protein